MSINKKRLCFNLIYLIIFVSLISLSNAIEFYEGNIKISAVKIDISVKGSDAIVNSIYTIKNNGINSESINLTFNDYTSPKISENAQGNVILSAGEIREISISSVENIDSNLGFNLDSEVLFNGLIHSNRIDNFLVNVELSDSNSILGGSSLDFIQPFEDRNFYSYSDVNIYPKVISFKINDYRSNVYVSRTHSEVSNVGESINIKVSLKNTGDVQINNIVFVDTFFESNFEPIVSDDFEFISLPNEPYYKMTKEVGSLLPLESKEFIYTLKVKSLDNLRLNPLRVFSNDKLIASISGSNIQTIYSESGSLAAPRDNTQMLINDILDNLQDENNEFPSDVDMNKLKEESDSYKWEKRKVTIFWIIAVIIFISAIVFIYLYIKKKNKVKVYVRENIQNP